MTSPAVSSVKAWTESPQHFNVNSVELHLLLNPAILSIFSPAHMSAISVPKFVFISFPSFFSFYAPVISCSPCYWMEKSILILVFLSCCPCDQNSDKQKWMDGWMDGWMDTCAFACEQLCHYYGYFWQMLKSSRITSRNTPSSIKLSIRKCF